ncbi:MAG: ribonuclease P protein component, partial [Streptosporangiales bacterium]|nr:ribonuclease P protein component [Streptosporangiales bacterium]
MLAARYRMRRRRDFESTLRRGSRTGRRLLVAHLGIVPDGAPLVGFVVSRAVGDAPTRNRVRRRLRHLMRERTVRLPEGARLVVRANPAVAGAGYAALGAEL